jgi:molecular chaperone DnaK
MVGFGIDFGTTNSVAAVVSGPDRALPLVDRDSGLPHPSVVWYRPEGVTVGLEAKRHLNTFAGTTGNTFITSVKRRLGSGKHIQVLGEPRQPSEVAAEIFRHLKDQAKESDFELDEVVVTIPVDFDGDARADLRQAAAAAGIEVVTFVHEPFAAVVGFYRQMGHDLDSLPDQTLLVFDWGGGTLDITVTRAQDGRLEELSTAGLNGLAGDHFDHRIKEWAQAQFLKKNRLLPEAFSLRVGTLDRLMSACERAKIELSESDETTIRLANILEIGDHTYDLREQLAQAEFEHLIRDDVQRAMREVDRALEEAELSEREVNMVLLIGGTSNIPLVKREMEQRFGTLAFNVENAQTIIAEGAAAVAFHRYQPFLSHSINLWLADGTPLPIFDRDTVVPIDGRKEITLYCTDNRDGDARLILAELRRIDDRHAPRQQVILNVPVSKALPQVYQHERIYATFEVNEDLILEVEAHGAAKREQRRARIHDLKFGLRLR